MLNKQVVVYDEKYAAICKDLVDFLMDTKNLDPGECYLVLSATLRTLKKTIAMAA